MGINSETINKRHIEQAALKLALLKQHTIKNFIYREYTHISAGNSNTLGNSNVREFKQFIIPNWSIELHVK